MKVILTFGPSYEPVDEVRRLTNFSTGELGTQLAEAFIRTGHEVICFRGVMASYPIPPGLGAIPFTTNDDLAAQLQAAVQSGEVAAVFHLAALCDYRVKRVEGDDDKLMASAKISSRTSDLKLFLEPSRKLITELRNWFPSALLVGWKYELDGSRADAIEKGRRQISEARTDACVVNGRAYGDGFGFLGNNGADSHIEDKEKLCAFLGEWLRHLERSREPSPRDGRGR